MPIDSARLIAYLRERAEHRNPLIHAVLMGTVARIERGDFDEEAD